MKKNLILLLSFISIQSFSQIGVGQWREHFPYRHTVDVCVGNQGIIYCATPFSVFSYNKNDNSVERYFKGNGLSDTDVTTINFSQEDDVLVVGYENGNLDLIVQGQLINVPELHTSSILADKRVNEVYFYQHKAYLSCGFGIVVVDLQKFEISDTYFLGDNASFIFVNDLERTDDFWYAATENGIYRASTSSAFLSNATAWSKLTNLPSNDINYLEVNINAQSIYLLADPNYDVTNRSIYYQTIGDSTWSAWDLYQNHYIRTIYLTEDEVSVSDWESYFRYELNHNETGHYWGYAGMETQGNKIVRDEEGWYWFANENTGLGGTPFSNYKSEKIDLNSPFKVNARTVDAYNNNVWIAAGGVSGAFVSQWSKAGLYGFVDEEWHNSRDFSDLRPADVLDVSINPNDNSEVFGASWHDGLVHIKDFNIIDIYDETNSTLEPEYYEGQEFTGVTSVDFDQESNLWFTAAHSNYPLHVRKADGSFQKFSFNTDITDENIVLNVFASSNNFIWIFIRGKGILVLDTKGTITDTSDDQYKLLSSEEGNGGLPSEYCYSITEDLDGEIWIGTQKGPAIFYSPESIFTETDFDAQQILITQDGNAQLLLATEVITGIEIDGGNRKWLATQNSGAYLLSADGTNQISHFTQENSPLLSNSLSDLAINHDNGEVFFVTERGVISYLGDATNFYEEMDNVQVYPNPVRPEYDGLITFDGLVRDADVKITDIQGNIVYHTIAEGGRAIWNGKRFDGSRPATGVYLVFITNDNGSSTKVSKVAFVN